MPLAHKSSCTGKQKQLAEHIEQGCEKKAFLKTPQPNVDGQQSIKPAMVVVGQVLVGPGNRPVYIARPVAQRNIGQKAL